MSNVHVEVQGVFAEVTRYPLEILDPEANLEQDLGIDSVKLGEVLSVLRERFRLPQDLDIAKESLLTIAGVSGALAEFLGKNGKNGKNGSATSNGNGSVGIHNGKSNGTSTVARAANPQLPGSLPAQPAISPSRSATWGRPSSGPAQAASLPQSARGAASRDTNGHGTGIPAGQPQYKSVNSGSAAATNHSSRQAATVQPASQLISVEELGRIVIEVFAEVTRYPKEILDPLAGLEDDLGIDSVKLGEVFSVLRERFGLSGDLEMPKESLGTIHAISQSLRQFMASNLAPAKPVSVKAVPPQNGAQQNGTVIPPLALHDVVMDVFAEVTRYPKEILDPTADLEQDLGIDSVKLGEVFSVLRERYSIPEKLEMPREKLRTIGEIANGLSEYIKRGTPAGMVSAAASANGNGTASVAELVENGAAPVHSGVESVQAGLHLYANPVVKPFTGKVVFISGSGRGLGKDIAEYLGELGASVVVNSFHSRGKGEETAEAIRNRGGDAIHSWGSMANPEHVQRVFDEIEKHYGHLDFFISNASNGMLARLEEITVEHWEKAYRTNVIGLHQSALRAVRLMRRRGGGKIITLSSPAAHGYVDYFGCMGAVKAAVESLTRSMAIEFAPYNIQVNCVSPGPVYGELLNKWPETERLVRQWENNTAYDRLCEARDVSHFIAYLLSEPVRLFTGSVLIMDGGISSQGW